MIEWHERVSDRLRLEAQASQVRNAPIALSDGEPESSVASSVDDQSIVDAAGYFSDPRPRPSFRPPNFHISPWAIPPQSPSYNSPQDAPWSSECRNTDSHFHRLPRNPSSWSCDGVTPTGLKPHNERWRRHHPRSPSTSSSSSSSTGSSALSSPVLHPTRPRAFPPLERRHSTSLPYNSPQQSHLSRSQTSYIPPQQPLSPPIPEALRSDVKGTNVRWRDIHDISHLSRSIPGTPDETPPYRYDRNGSSRDRGRSDPDRDSKSSKARMKSPVRGVGGRRYATEGMSWRWVCPGPRPRAETERSKTWAQKQASKDVFPPSSFPLLSLFFFFLRLLLAFGKRKYILKVVWFSDLLEVPQSGGPPSGTLRKKYTPARENYSNLAWLLACGLEAGANLYWNGSGVFLFSLFLLLKFLVGAWRPSGFSPCTLLSGFFPPPVFFLFSTSLYGKKPGHRLILNIEQNTTLGP